MTTASQRPAILKRQERHLETLEAMAEAVDARITDSTPAHSSYRHQRSALVWALQTIRRRVNPPRHAPSTPAGEPPRRDGPRVVFESHDPAVDLLRALKQIATYPCVPDEASGEYALGVRDGHACAAQLARAALEANGHDA